MRKILMFLVLIISIKGFSQNPANYQYRVVFERSRGGMFDSAFHPPRYNGLPVGLRIGSATHDGAFVMDTLNGRGYLRWNGSWVRMANFSELATGSRFGVEDAVAGQNRIFTGLNNTYYLALDSLNYFRVDRDGVTRMYMDNTSTLLASPDNSRTLQIFNASTRLTGLAVGPGEKQLRIVPGTGIITYADTSASAATPTLQQVFATQSNNAVLTSNVLVDMSANGTKWTYYSSTNSGSPVVDIQNTGAGVAIQTISIGDPGGIFQTENATGNTVLTSLQSVRQTSSTPANGLGNRYRQTIETSTGANQKALDIGAWWTDVTNGSRTTNGLFVSGVNNAVDDTLLLLDHAGIAIVNNKADTLATKAYARSVGGGGGYTNLTQFVDQNNWQMFYSNGSGDVTELAFGTSGKVLTSNGTTSAPTWETPATGSGTVNTGAANKAAYYPSAGTTVDDVTGVEFNGTNILQKNTTQNAADVGLQVNGTTSQSADVLQVRDVSANELFSVRPNGAVDILPSFDGWYDVHSNFAFSDQPLFRLSNFGAGSTIGTLNGATIFDGWMFGLYMETGTTTTGSAYSYGYSSGQIAGIAISNSFRYNVGGLFRVEDLSDGTETYNYSLGFGDDWGNGVSAIVDGVYIEYTHSLNSGNITFTTESNGTKTQTDTGVAVAADTDYRIDISVYNGNAYCYVNNVLVATNTTNIPTGTARATTIGHAIAKSAGTTNRKAYVEWFAYGKRSN